MLDDTCMGVFPEVPWYIYRDSYRRYPEDDEWELASSWTGERRVLEGTQPDKLWVTIKLRIQGRWHGRRCRPKTWSARFIMEGVEETIGHGKCKSCLDAARQVDSHPNFEPALDKLLGRAYGEEGARCVYRRDHSTGLWEMWGTNLGFAWSAHRQWPAGEYVEVYEGRDGESAYTVHKISTYWSSGGQPPEDFDRELYVGWLNGKNPMPFDIGEQIFTVKCGNRGEVKHCMGGMVCVGWPNGTSSWHSPEALRPLPSRYDRISTSDEARGYG